MADQRKYVGVTLEVPQRIRSAKYHDSDTLEYAGDLRAGEAADQLDSTFHYGRHQASPSDRGTLISGNYFHKNILVHIMTADTRRVRSGPLKYKALP